MAKISVFPSVSALIFGKEIVGEIFDLRENGGNGTVKDACFVFPQPTPRVLCPLFPYFPPISPHFPPFSPFFPFSQAPKSGFGELVRSVAVSAGA